jgi:hypothetical protein
MPYNITLEFMDNTYNVKGSMKKAFNLGDIVEVYDHRKGQVQGTMVTGSRFEFTEPPITPRKWFMHVTGVPDQLDFTNLKNVLMSVFQDRDLAIVANPKGEMERFRKWGIDYDGMSAKDKSDLANTKQVTYSYAKFQNAIVDKTGGGNLFTEAL